MYRLLSLNPKQINYPRELMGGLVNFMAMAYIIIVNPMVLNAGGQAFPIEPSITATILIIIIMTTVAGFLIKLPFVIAPGMGINAIIGYTLVAHDKLPINIVLGIIFWSSLILFILSVTPLRQKIIDAIPYNIQIALSVGIGLFLIFIGFKHANIIISNPNTLIGINKFDITIGLCIIGFILATVLFIKHKVYAMVLPIIVVTILSFLINKNSIPKHIFTIPDFSLFMHIDFLGSLKLSIIPAIISLFIVNFFDATCSMVGLFAQIEYKTKAEKNSYYTRALATDGLAGIVGGIVGTAPGVVFVESSAGIQSGAKTGLASIVTAILCIPFLFLSPLISIIPSYATAPVLILVGIIMMDNNLRNIKFQSLEDFISVVLTIIMMPFCFSITAGAVFGIISFTLFKLLLGKFNELNPTLIIVALCCSSWFIN